MRNLLEAYWWDRIQSTQCGHVAIKLCDGVRRLISIGVSQLLIHQLFCPWTVRPYCVCNMYSERYNWNEPSFIQDNLTTTYNNKLEQYTPLECQAKELFLSKMNPYSSRQWYPIEMVPQITKLKQFEAIGWLTFGSFGTFPNEPWSICVAMWTIR